MMGELIAIASAFFYGLGGVAIAKGRISAVGDNGVFLSVVVTAAVSLALWLGWGRVPADALLTVDALSAIGCFALAGIASTVFARIAMYRATEQIGAVMASLLRRLIPVFTLPLAFVLLHQVPDARVLIGGAIILGAVLIYARPNGGAVVARPSGGLILGTVSAFLYAVAYSLRGLGLMGLPDPVLGTFIGAAVGLVCLIAFAGLSETPARAFRRLVVDRGRWHWLAALAFTTGQTMQFFALNAAAVSTVAVLGTLEVVFAAVLGAWVLRTETLNLKRFACTAVLMLAGTILICV